MINTKYVMNFSGGLCSWFAADRLIKWYGRDKITLLFADTNFEHPDLYRFIDDVEDDFKLKVVRISDGRTPWDVFFDNRFLGNSRIDLCSRILKRELLNKWHEDNHSRRDSYVCVGLSYGEVERYRKFKSRMNARGWRTMAPAMSKPHFNKHGMMKELRIVHGIDPPELYEDGFPHNNCGGFCMKAGQAQFRLLLQKRRDFYLYNECKEEEFRAFIGQDVSIMRDRTGGIVKPLTLKVFRERIESGQVHQVGDWGGCGCAID